MKFGIIIGLVAVWLLHLSLDFGICTFKTYRAVGLRWDMALFDLGIALVKATTATGAFMASGLVFLWIVAHATARHG